MLKIKRDRYGITYRRDHVARAQQPAAAAGVSRDSRSRSALRGAILRALAGATAVTMAVAVSPAFAQPQPVRTTAAFWNAVQQRCDATAAQPPSALGQRIAQIAINEFTEFGGHQIDADGRLFHFGLTEAEHQNDSGGDVANTGKLGWWRMMKYWRAMFGADPTDKLEVRGYGDASTATDETQSVPLLRTNAARLLHAAEGVSDPADREILREAILRAAIIDTPWSAAFISYVIRQAGVQPGSFRFANAHRAFIYDAFHTSAAEVNDAAGAALYRACPLATTRPRPGDLICEQREPALTGLSGLTVRERIRGELDGDPSAYSIRQTHCEVVAYADQGARKLYTIGGNVDQAITVRKLNLRRDLKFSTTQKGHCGGAGHWTLPHPMAEPPRNAKCSLNDKKWFVLLQLR